MITFTLVLALLAQFIDLRHDRHEETCRTAVICACVIALAIA